MKKRLQQKLKRSRREKLSIEERENQELRIMLENFASAQKLRHALAEAMKEKPAAEGFAHLEKLDRSIYFEKRRIDSFVMSVSRRNLKLLTRDLNNIVDETTDEQFQRLGSEAQPFKTLKSFIASRQQLGETLLEKINPELKPEDLLAEFDANIEKVRRKLDARLEKARQIAAQKAEADRRYAETQALYKKVFPGYVDLRERFDESLNDEYYLPLNAEGTEYEMSEDYKEAVEKREAAIEYRDFCRRQIEKLIAENKQGEDFDEFVKSVDDIDEWIEHTGKLLQDEKEAHQKSCRARDELEARITDYENALQDEIAKNPQILLGGKPKPKGQ